MTQTHAVNVWLRHQHEDVACAMCFCALDDLNLIRSHLVSEQWAVSCGKIKREPEVCVFTAVKADREMLPRVTEAFWAFAFFTGSTGGFWPERNLNVKLEEKVKPPPTLLLLSSHQWGILATLIHVLHSFFTPEPALWRKRVGASRCWWWAGVSYILSLLPDFKAASSPCSTLKSPKTWQH